MEKLIYWFSRNHVAANFVMLLILLLGFKTWFTLKKEIFPETALDMVAIQVPFPNASPEEVEKGIILPIEEAIEDLEGIERITSVAAQNIGTVTVEAQNGHDIRNLMDDIKTRVDAIDNFAEEAEEPVLEELLIKANVLSVAVYVDSEGGSIETDEATLRRLAERVRDELLLFEYQPPLSPIPPLRLLQKAFGLAKPSGITQVELGGARPYEISIEVSENTLRELGITFDHVANAVRASSLDLPGGSIRTNSGEILIRTEQKRYTAAEFAGITVITRPDGSRVQLDEIATIVDGFEEDDLENRFDGKQAILVNVFRSGNEDTLKIAAAVKKFVYEKAPLIMPEGVKLEIWKDDSVFLKGRMDLLKKNGVLGLLLVFVVLALFLRPSLAFLVSIGIPVSFAGAIMMMPYTGISINMISLFAFILVLGIVVDDAIVVSENVFRRLRTGENPKIAAPAGTHEVGVVVTFGVLTTVVAFTPMLGLSGVSGRIWPNIPWIVIPTLLFSLLQSKLVLPAHLSLLRASDPNRRESAIIRFQHKFSHGLERFVDRFYRPVLRVVLRNRYVVLCGFLAIFIVTASIVASGWLRFQFFPKVEADVVSAKVEMPTGVPFETTQRAVAQLDAAAEILGGKFTDKQGRSIIAHRLATSGAHPFQTGFIAGGPPRSTNIGEVTIELRSSSERDVTAEELASEWRKLAGPVPGAVDLTFQSQAAGGGNAIDLEVSGPSIEELEQASAIIRGGLAAYLGVIPELEKRTELQREIVAELEANEGIVKNGLAGYTGVIDIADNNRRGNQELKLDVLPGGEALGLRLQDIARQARQGFYGEEAQRIQRGRDEVKVMVRYPRAERKNIDNLSNIKIRTRQGDEVPFGEVATWDYGRSYATVQRADRRRAIVVTADIDKTVDVNANEVVASLQNEIFPYVKSRFPQINFAFQGEQKDQRQSVQEIGQGMIIALVFMYILMAIPLKSYLQPLIVMSVIPFGIVGAIIGHMMMGWMELSIMSMCGIVALSGVVVNDSLVLVDYVNRHRDDGHGLINAVREAGAIRFRPILLTSLTTFAGLTPMLLETDMQARFLIPMAVSLSFGILFATAITLLLIPCVYLILEDAKNLLRKLFMKRGEPRAETAPAS